MNKGCAKKYSFLVIGFIALGLGLIVSSPVSATDPSSSATATVHVAEACSLTSSNITPHTDNMSNGTSTESLGSTKFTVKCNDASGFALYAIGYSGDEYGATSMLGDNELSIPTGTDASAGNTTSHWSMKISKDTTSYLPNSLTIENSFGSQHLIPSTYTKIASFPSSTDGINGTGSSILATYGVRISGTQAAGTYIGKVKYTLVHPNMNDNSNKPAEPLPASACPANSICYAPNTPDIVGTMVSSNITPPTLASVSSYASVGNQTQTRNESNSLVGISSNSTAQLIAPNYSREGYGFAGWSTDFEADDSSIIYGPNETITVPDVSSHGLILYPVWIASTGNLQGADGQGWTGCSSLTTAPADGSRATLASMTALKDTRDNNVYTVARLADGKCWMVENLRLNAEDSRGDANAAKAQGYGDATANNLGKFIGLADSEDTNFTTGSTSSATDPTTANSIYYAGTQSGTATIDIFQTNFASFRIPRYNNNNTNMATGATNSDGSTTLTDRYNGSGNNLRWFGYGNYYSWSAAVADTSYYSYDSPPSTTTSICPKGWRLPIGNKTVFNTTGDFYVLNKTLMGGTEPNNNNTNYYGTVDNVNLGVKASKLLRAFPNNFVYSGYFNESSAGLRGNDGFYWSSSVINSSSAYYLTINYNRVFPGTEYLIRRSIGFSVRCIR